MHRLFRRLVLTSSLSLLCSGGAISQNTTPQSGRDIAKAEAQDTAKDLVVKGFIIRGDSWSGEALDSGKVGVRHHLFKGNEYVFVLGGTFPSDIEFSVLTPNRKPVPSEVTTDGKTATIRLNPPKTGTYLIVFSLKSSDHERIPWALVYGYR